MRYIGIDLGTTYSCVTATDDVGSVPEVVRNAAGELTTPSVVFVSDDGPVVGTTAKKKLRTMPDRTVAMAKRFMGTDKVWSIGGTDYTPVDVSACILKEVFAGLDIGPGEDYSCVITCPASYSQTQRVLVKEAAKKAGIKEPGIINEPTAAALSYCAREGKEQGNVIIFDLGGGTLDVTAIHFDKPADRYEVLASDGKPYLGGADWDKVIEDMIYDLMSESMGKPVDELSSDVVISSQVRSEAERIKKELTTMDFSDTIYVKGTPVDIDISRSDFDDRTGGLLNEAVSMVATVMDIVDANRGQHGGLGSGDLDAVVLVGGSCKMPQVMAGIEAAYPRFAGKIHVYEPDLAISRGAAYYAKMSDPSACGGKMADFSEVLSTTFGVQFYDPEVQELFCCNMLFKNDVIPQEMRREFYLNKGQARIESRVYKNAARDKDTQLVMDIEDCSVLVDFSVDFPFAGRDREPLFITYRINLDGTLTVVTECRDFVDTFDLRLSDFEGNLDHADM